MVETLRSETGKKPVVGLAGFFGYGNYGDELFVSVYKEYLQDHFDLRFLSDQLIKPYYSKPIQEIVNGVDAIVIGGGDIVQPWNLDPRYFSKEFLKKPVFIVGVGVPIRSGPSVNPKHAEKEWIVEKYRDFFNHPSIKLIHARDEQSANWITSKTKPKIGVREAPDLVCALTLPEASRPSNYPVLGIVTRQRPEQEDDYTQINALAEQQRLKGWAIRHIILGTGNVGIRDKVDANDVTGPKELVVSESLDDLTRAIGSCTALISMKFHGTVVATMYGVPSTVLIPTNKNRNFMKRLDREDLLSRYDDFSLSSRFSVAPIPPDPDALVRLRNGSTKILIELRDMLLKAVG